MKILINCDEDVGEVILDTLEELQDEGSADFLEFEIAEPD